jgi:tetratricopeptide (TPR) repeat protein
MGGKHSKKNQGEKNVVLFLDKQQQTKNTAQQQLQTPLSISVELQSNNSNNKDNNNALLSSQQQPSIITSIINKEENQQQQLPSTIIVNKVNEEAQLTQIEGGGYVNGISLKHLIELINNSNDVLNENSTMTDLVQKVIKPLTESNKESYLQLLSRTQPDKVKPIADHFISYVWAYNLKKELLPALQHTLLKDDKDDAFIWLDGLCVNQHQVSTTKATPEQLQITFGESLKAIKSVVMVLVNWCDPSYSKRIWCVFEAFITKKSNTNVILAMSKQEEQSLIDAMIYNAISDSYLDSLFSRVDVESAKAKEPEDQATILELIRKFGVSEVNGAVLDNLKGWLVHGGELALKTVEPDSGEAGNICAARRAIHQALGEFDLALEWSEKALNIDLKLYGPEHQEVATDYNNIAASLQILGRLDEALVANDKAMAIMIKNLGPNHPNTISGRSWKAGILRDQGKLEEALVIYSEVLESRKRVLGEDHIDTVAAMSYKGGCLRQLKRFDEALPLYNESITITKRTLGENHPTLAAYFNNKALCLKGMGRPEEALPIYDQVIAIDSKVYGSEHPDVATDLLNKAACLNALKLYNEALVLFDQSLTIYLKTYGNNEHADVGKVLGFKATCLKHLGREKEAMELGKQALGIYERTLGYDHYRTVILRKNWGG